MPLSQDLENSGNWLFRYRSYLPLILLPVILYYLNASNPYDIDLFLYFVGLFISFFGEMIRILTIAFVPSGSSGRNTKFQYANNLNTTGIYSTVRHPLYLGNFFIYLGPFIYTGSITGIIIYILLFWVYYERIMYAEEVYLKNHFYDIYNAWSYKTPCFVPNIRLYEPSANSFSINRILDREYTGICGIPIFYITLLISHNYLLKANYSIDNSLIYICIFNFILYIILRRNNKVKRKH